MQVQLSVHPPMIIKLHQPLISFSARHIEKKESRVLTFQEKVKLDRLFLAVCYLTGIVATILFA